MVIPPRIRDAVQHTFGADPDVAAVYLFGSHARGNVKPSSDVDLALVMVDGFPFEERFDYVLSATGAMEDRLGTPTDVVLLNRADPVVQYQVRKEGKLLIENDRGARIRWEVRSRKFWFDRQPAHRLYMQKLEERLSRSHCHG